MQNKRILLKGGTVVSGSEIKKEDLAIAGECIVQVDEKIEPEGDDICVDVSGKLLFPGFIDAHTHFDLRVANTVTADDFCSGSRAAVLGGTTTVIDFATQYRGETLHQALENWFAKAEGKAHCDYGFHLALSDWNDGVKKELEQIVRDGIPTFKLYMTYSDMMVSDTQIYEILKRLKELGAIAGVHCEDDALIREQTVRMMQDEILRKKVSSHFQARPAEAEANAIKRLLQITEKLDMPVIIVHLSSKAGYREIREARERGQKVVVETCPQYLLLDENCYEKEGLEGARYVIAPPLRKKEDNKYLWECLAEGQIQTLATDHCSFTVKQKEMGLENFTKIPGGMPGVETRAVLLHEFGVNQRKISLPQMCSLLTENAAKIYGIFPQKGVLRVGSDADIVVFDPNKEQIITAKTQSSKAGYSPYEGMSVTGSIQEVYQRGILTVSKGKMIKEYRGKYLKRRKMGE